MGQLNYTTAEIQKLLDETYHTAIQDVVGDNYTSGVPLVMTGGQSYAFACNGNTRNYKNLPTHVTNIWNTATNVATFAQFLNTPEIVANVQFAFTPSSANAGTITLDVYVNEDVPILMKSYTITYKGSAQRYTILSTFYAGAATGFDVKNKGVIFKLTASGNGSLYDTAIEIYKT